MHALSLTSSIARYRKFACVFIIDHNATLNPCINSPLDNRVPLIDAMHDIISLPLSINVHVLLKYMLLLFPRLQPTS